MIQVTGDFTPDRQTLIHNLENLIHQLAWNVVRHKGNTHTTQADVDLLENALVELKRIP